MNKADIPFLSVVQLSELIKSRQVSPVEVVEGYLDRIDSLNDRLYAYLTVCRDQALEAARELERELARGDYRGNPETFAPGELFSSLGLRGGESR